MRNLTDEEKMLIRNDIKELVRICLNNNLINDNFRKRYKGLSIKLGDIEGACNAGGKTSHRSKLIVLKEENVSDDFMRKTILYHEIGHLLFDYKAMEQEDTSIIEKRVLSIVENNKLNNINPLECLAGLSMIQEYIAEKFSTMLTHNTLDRDIEVRKDIKNKVSGNYTYDTSFYSNYGLIETICDDLIDKTYSSLFQILDDCLNSKFYIGLFENYNEIELVIILEKLGKIYNILDEFTTNEFINDTKITEKLLMELSDLTSTISLKEKQRENELLI